MTDENNLINWLDFLKARTIEEFEMIVATDPEIRKAVYKLNELNADKEVRADYEMVAQNPEIRKAVYKLYELSADKKVRAEYEMRQKARRDRLWEIDNARQEGMEKKQIETARNALAEGLPINTISKITGLSPEEIAKL